MLCIPYNSIELNNNAMGKIFRIYNKSNNKSYINYTNNNLFTISNIINELKNNKFIISAMQNDWNKSIANFYAEDLQLYYSINELPILMLNWQKYFGGKNNSLLYNIEEFKNYKNVDEVLDENKYYIYYTTELLNVNKSLQEQLNILNQNYINLQTYNNNIKDDLTSINTVITQQIKNSPIQILQMLTSLLTIASAECNIQFSNNKISQISKTPQINKTFQVNNLSNNNSSNNSLENDIYIPSPQIFVTNSNETNSQNKQSINTSKNNTNKNSTNTSKEKINTNTTDKENISKNTSSKEKTNIGTDTIGTDTKTCFNKINAAIQIIQQYIPNLKRLIKALRSNQFVKPNNKDKIQVDMNDIQQLFNRINAQLIIYKENIVLLNNTSQWNNVINKINKQLQSFKNDFNGLKSNINNRIKQMELKNNSRINTDNLSMDELMKLKLQKSNENNNENNNNTVTIVNKTSLKSIENEASNLKLFPLFDNKKSIRDWLRIAYQWLIDNNYINFAQELQFEVNKSLINKSPTKALNCALAYNKGLNYNDIAKQFNTVKDRVIRNIDSLQNTHPAIYLALGYKSKNSQGKNKRVIRTLHNLNITNIPAEL